MQEVYTEVYDEYDQYTKYGMTKEPKIERPV